MRRHQRIPQLDTPPTPVRGFVGGERRPACLQLADLESVLVEVSFLREGAVAARADVVLAVRVVNEHVRAQVGLVSERPITAGVRAPVRPLTGVCPHVTLQQPPYHAHSPAQPSHCV